MSLLPRRAGPVLLPRLGGGLLASALSILLSGWAGPLPAQEAARTDSVGIPLAERPRLRAVRRSGPIDIDGRLDEAAWEAADVADDFVQGDPTEGAEPAQPTRARLLYDEDALYVGVRLVEENPSVIRDQLVRRDEEGQYDYLEFTIDPNLDRQTGYLFRLSAAGQERDAFLFDDTDQDVDFDAVWTSAVSRDSTGWTAEMRIPFSQFRFESRPRVQTWGVNFVRRRLASNSLDFFAVESRTVDGRVSQFGRLEGIEVPGDLVRLELEPFLAPQLFTGPSETGDPFFDGTETDLQAGLDLSFGLGPAFSLDATFNPDFGQVEVDPEVVNLTAFETFFPEQRPFFVQDARVFDFRLSGRQNTLFFSRRIGADPTRGGLPGATFTDVPDRTTIVGASKLTGRTTDGLSVGVLAALTQEETGEAFFADSGRVETFVAEPLSFWGVGRVQQDLRDGFTQVGAILTAVERDVSDGDPLAERLTRRALSGGLDFEHNWGGPSRRDWHLWGYFSGSRVEGRPEVLVDIQTNSQHFFQRPDAPNLRVDSTATSLTGVNWHLEGGRQSAEHLTWTLWSGGVSPDFAVNDLGFMTERQHIDVGGQIAYQDIEPAGPVRNWEVSALTNHDWRWHLVDDLFSPEHWSDTYAGGFANADFEIEFMNNWEAEASLDVSPTADNADGTRGGVLMTEPGNVGGSISFTTDPRKTVSVEPSVEFGRRFLDAGDSFEVGAEVTFRPTPAWELSIGPEFSLEDDAAQFVTTVRGVPFAPTFDRIHVFSDLERREFSMVTRMNVTFTPTLSLQLFAQPLVSAGDFVSYKQLAAPRSFEFLRFREGSAEGIPGGGVRCAGGTTCESDGRRFLDFEGDGTVDASFEDEDFNVRSLRANLVLRWEYMSGSTLFLVWQETRFDEQDFGDFDLGRDLEGLLEADSEDTFILKVKHFLSL